MSRLCGKKHRVINLKLLGFFLIVFFNYSLQKRAMTNSALHVKKTLNRQVKTYTPAEYVHVPSTENVYYQINNVHKWIKIALTDVIQIQGGVVMTV